MRAQRSAAALKRMRNQGVRNKTKRELAHLNRSSLSAAVCAHGIVI